MTRPFLAAALALTLVTTLPAAGASAGMPIAEDLANNSMSAEELRETAVPQSPRIVVLDEELEGERAAQIKQALDDTEDNYAEVRTAIEYNVAFEAALDRAKVDISDVLAVTRSERGDFTVYLRKGDFTE